MPAAAEPATVIDYAKQKKAPARKSTVASLEFRRTLIPPCLVVGIAFPILTLLFFLQPSTSALRHANVLIPIVIALVGFAVLAVGVLNMLMVKKELDAQQAAKKAVKAGGK